MKKSILALAAILALASQAKGPAKGTAKWVRATANKGDQVKVKIAYLQLFRADAAQYRAGYKMCTAITQANGRDQSDIWIAFPASKFAAACKHYGTSARYSSRKAGRMKVRSCEAVVDTINNQGGRTCLYLVVIDAKLDAARAKAAAAIVGTWRWCDKWTLVIRPDNTITENGETIGSWEYLGKNDDGRQRYRVVRDRWTDLQLLSIDGNRLDWTAGRSKKKYSATRLK